MLGAPRPGLAVGLSSSAATTIFLSSSASILAAATSGSGARHCCNLVWLVLLTKRWESLVRIESDGGHRQLFGGLKDLVGFFENLLVSGAVEGFITNVSPHVYWELEGPDGQGGTGAAAPHKLLRLPTDVIYYLVSQLRR